MGTKVRESNVEKEKLEIIKWVTGLKDRDAIEKLRLLRDSPKKLAGGARLRTRRKQL